ncbi:MAG: tRNA-dihydrouridine synthase family protein [Christensenellaceae bacterium]|jgi:nifR3 family TIM-barrel protein|nr:tRNA-dihydrouridine synthase family protein [Christensenellaceae bacterium]
MTAKAELQALIPKGSLFLAPMAGVGDAPFRALCARQGADFCVTEMISAKGLVLGPQNREEVALLSRVSPGEQAFLQLFGSEDRFLVEAALRFEGGPYLGIDFNLGCPAPKIVSNGDGSALLRNLPKAQKSIEAMAKALKKPLSVKMRLGWDAQSRVFLEAARRFEDAGAAFITLHARTRSQFYGEKADWAAIGETAAKLSIPVVGNGDVRTPEDAEALLRQTGCHAVMIGRGAMGNPWLFAQIKRARQGLAPLRVSPGERLETALGQARELAALRGEPAAVREMRKHMAWYVKGLRGATAARLQINACQSLGALEETLHALAAAQPSEG